MSRSRRSAEAPAHPRLVLATVSLTQLLIVLDGTIVNVALPRAQADLGLSDGTRQWVITAYALAFGALLLLGGRVADFWGRRRTFVLGLALFGAGSAWGGLATTGGGLLAARGLQGLAAALMAPAALAILTVTFPGGRERNVAFAIFGAVAGAGSAIGLLVGGLLSEYLGWRWCLLVNVPFVVLGVVAASTLLVESRVPGRPRYDLFGATTVAVGLGGLVYGLTLAERSWTSPATVGCLATGVAGLALFVLVEARSDHPMLPLRILRHRGRAAAFLLQALTGAVMIGAMLYLTFHLQIVLGMRPLAAGLATLPITLGIMSTVPFATRLLNRIGPRRQLLVGPVVAAVGVASLCFVTVGGSYWREVLPGALLLGVGMGFTFVPLQNLALLGVEPRDAGAAAAAANAAGQVGASVGLAALTALYVAVTDRAAHPDSAQAAVDGYAVVFAVGAVLLVLCAVVAAVLVDRDAIPRAVDDLEDVPAVPVA